MEDSSGFMWGAPRFHHTRVLTSNIHNPGIHDRQQLSSQEWWPQPSSPTLSRWWPLPSRGTHLKWWSQHNSIVSALTLTPQKVLPPQSHAKTNQIKILTSSVPKLNLWLSYPTCIPTWIPYNFPNFPLFSLSSYLIPKFQSMQAFVSCLADANATMVIVNCLRNDSTHPTYLCLSDFISSLTKCKDTLQGINVYRQAPLSVLLHQGTHGRLFRFVLFLLFYIFKFFILLLVSSIQYIG